MRHRTHKNAIEELQVQELEEHGFQVHDVEGLQARHDAILNEPESPWAPAGLTAMADHLLAEHPAIALALSAASGQLGLAA
jgi:hypothetical protein